MIALIVSGASLAFAGGVVLWARRQAKRYPDNTPQPCKVCAAIDELSELESDEAIPDAIVETLREAYTIPRLTPVSQREQDAAPTSMPLRNARFVVWSRGAVDTWTDDPTVMKRAWERVTQRAGVHQLWDAHHLPGPRTVKVIPLSVGEP